MMLQYNLRDRFVERHEHEIIVTDFRMNPDEVHLVTHKSAGFAGDIMGDINHADIGENRG